MLGLKGEEGYYDVRDYLVCFEKNALGNYPDRKTIMSKNHKVMYENKMTEAYKFLKHFKNVKKVKYNQEKRRIFKDEIFGQLMMEIPDKDIEELKANSTCVDNA